MESRLVYRRVEYANRLNRDILDTPHKYLTEKLAIGVNDTKDFAFINATVLNAKVAWGAAVKSRVAADEANAALKDFVNSYPFIGKSKHKESMANQESDEEKGRKLMERFIKYRDSLKKNEQQIEEQ